MNFQYFKDVNTIEELRRQYKTLAFKYHPDKGGTKEQMQQIHTEYDELLKRVRNVHETADGKTYTKETPADVPDNFREIINAIINFNCRIELCGAWLWVFNAYEYRVQLKNLGFFWCSSKKAWAWTDKPTDNKYRLSLDEIRRLHGSEVIKEEEKEQQKRIKGGGITAPTKGDKTMLHETEVKKITAVIEDFAIKAHFNVADLQQYDNTVLEKLKDKTLYEEIADINLSKIEGKNLYGGENVRVYKSVKNGHYIYSRYYWGD